MSGGLEFERFFRPQANVMTLASRDVLAVRDTDSVGDAIQRMLAGYRKIPVVSKGRFSGLVTATDILDYLGAGERHNPKKDYLSLPVGRIMETRVTTLYSRHGLKWVWRATRDLRRGSYPVLKEGRLVGMLADWDFLKRIKGNLGIRVEEIMAARPARVREGQDRQEEEKRGKNRKNAVYIGIGVLVIIGLAFAVASFPMTGNSIKDFDISGIPNSFVHWHADVDIIVCGEDKNLPEALPGKLLGASSLHTHAKTENIRSLPNSDGNGVIHNEAVIPSQPGEQTLGRFLDHMNIPFSEGQIMDKKNGDKCPEGEEGRVRLFVNGNENPQWRNYIPRDGDIIKIEFS